jgi:hypothetical protein
MDTIADDIIIGWCDLDPKTRYPVAAAVVLLFKRPNDEAPLEWASLTRQLLVKAPDPEAIFKEIVGRLHPTNSSGSLATELEARLTLLDQLDITAVPALAVALDATKATLKRQLEAERRRIPRRPRHSSRLIRTLGNAELALQMVRPTGPVERPGSRPATSLPSHPSYPDSACRGVAVSQPVLSAGREC